VRPVCHVLTIDGMMILIDDRGDNSYVLIDVREDNSYK
jgi:hypothetical protein